MAKKTATTKKKTTSVEKETTTIPQFQPYFTKHELPDAKWFEAQQKDDSTSKLGANEFFHLFSTLTSDPDRMVLLRKAKSDKLIMTLLNMNYSPQIYGGLTPLPDEATMNSVRESKLPWGYNPYTLRNQYRRLGYLINHSPDAKKTPPHAREKILLEMLESLHPSEARILRECLTQSLFVPGLTPEIVRKAFGESRFPFLTK